MVHSLYMKTYFPFQWQILYITIYALAAPRETPTKKAICVQQHAAKWAVWSNSFHIQRGKREGGEALQLEQSHKADGQFY